MQAERKFIRINERIYNCTYKSKNVLCYLPQHDFLPKHLTIGKVAKLYLNKASCETFFNDSILEPIKHNKASYVSGGELRYMEIKLLLNTNSKFVMLDEPFNGVSPIMVDTIKEMIKEASKTKGIILTDHDYRNVLDVANRYCMIYDGGIKIIKDKYELVRWGYISENKIF